MHPHKETLIHPIPKYKCNRIDSPAIHHKSINLSYVSTNFSQIYRLILYRAKKKKDQHARPNQCPKIQNQAIALCSFEGSTKCITEKSKNIITHIKLHCILTSPKHYQLSHNINTHQTTLLSSLKEISPPLRYNPHFEYHGSTSPLNANIWLYLTNGFLTNQ